VGEGKVAVTVNGLRSSKGMLRACLTRDRHHYPDCEDDPAAFTASVSASGSHELDFARLPAGDYALLILHDENGNGRIDKMLGIPREGVGFSRNPKLFMGPPSFDAVRFTVAGEESRQTVHMRYFL
jgi:uncharacterized protein (DUF2141 family)